MKSGKLSIKLLFELFIKKDNINVNLAVANDRPSKTDVVIFTGGQGDLRDANSKANPC
jgi:hypothetical protein